MVLWKRFEFWFSHDGWVGAAEQIFCIIIIVVGIGMRLKVKEGSS